MTRALISDFGGVLTTPLVEAFAAYRHESGLGPEDLGNAMAAAAERHGGQHPLFELEKGLITEEEFARRLEAELGNGVRLSGLRDVYFGHLQPNAPMIDYVATLPPRGVRTALCTNNVREWEPLWRPMLPAIDEIFEVIVDSAFVGTRKPEPEIYRITLERLGVEAGECVFVDDLAHNCEAAEALGMRAVVFHDAEQAIPEVEAALADG